MRIVITLLLLLYWCAMAVYLSSYGLMTRTGAAVLLGLFVFIMLSLVRHSARQHPTTSWIPIPEDQDESEDKTPYLKAA